VCVHAGEIGKYSRAPDQDFRDGNDQDNRENRIASAVSAISPSDSGPQDRDMCLEDHNCKRELGGIVRNPVEPSARFTIKKIAINATANRRSRTFLSWGRLYVLWIPAHQGRRPI